MSGVFKFFFLFFSWDASLYSCEDYFKVTLTVKLCVNVQTGWNNPMHVHLNGSLTMPQKYYGVHIYNFNLRCFFSHGGRIKGWQTIFLVRSLVCKALYFGVSSNSGWFLNGAPEEHVSIPLKLGPPSKSWADSGWVSEGEEVSCCSAFVFFDTGIAPNLGILPFPLRWRFLLHPCLKGLKIWCSGFTPDPTSLRFQSKSSCTVLFLGLIWVAELHLASVLK